MILCSIIHCIVVLQNLDFLHLLIRVRNIYQDKNMRLQIRREKSSKYYAIYVIAVVVIFHEFRENRDKITK